MNDYLLTFELSPQKDELHICTDVAGLDYLVNELSKLLDWAKTGKTEHIHLMTEEWGGYELSSSPQVGYLLNHVKVYCWNEDQMSERGETKN